MEINSNKYFYEIKSPAKYVLMQRKQSVKELTLLRNINAKLYRFFHNPIQT